MEKAENRLSIVSSTIRLAPIWSIGEFEPQEQGLEVVVADLGQFGRVDRDMLDGDLRLVDQPCRSKPSEATLATISTGRSSKVTKTPGSS